MVSMGLKGAERIVRLKAVDPPAIIAFCAETQDSNRGRSLITASSPTKRRRCLVDALSGFESNSKSVSISGNTDRS
jgi:hypothetical protein